MIVIAGYSLNEDTDRDAVAAFQPMVERTRREGGCIDLHVSADPLDAERINDLKGGPTGHRSRRGSRSPILRRSRFAKSTPISFEPSGPKARFEP
jgi:hypothetical protein